MVIIIPIINIIYIIIISYTYEFYDVRAYLTCNWVGSIYGISFFSVSINK